MIDFDLLNPGIAFDVKNALALQQIVIEFLSPADVEDGVRFAVELLDFRQANSGRRMLWQIARTKAPAPLEAELARQLAKELRGIGKVVARVESLRVVGNPRGVFNVINIVAETLQADDVMDVLPNDAGDRHRAHESHDDDSFAFHEEIINRGFRELLGWEKTQHSRHSVFIQRHLGNPRSEILYHDRRISGDDRVGGDAFRDNRSPAATTEFSPIVTPLRMTAFIPIQTLSRDPDRRGPNRRARRTLLIIRRKGQRVDSPLCWIDRMKIRVGDPDIPGNQGNSFRSRSVPRP